MIARLETSSATFQLREDAQQADDESLNYLDVTPHGTMEDEGRRSSSPNEETEKTDCSKEHCAINRNDGEAEADFTHPVMHIVAESNK